MAFHLKNSFFAVVRKWASAVIAALWATPFIQHGSTKRATPATNAACVADGGAGRPALPDVQANGIRVGAVDGGRESISAERDVLVAPLFAAAAESRTGIAELRRLGVSCRGRRFKEKALCVCERIDSITNSAERAAVLRELSDSISSLSAVPQSVSAAERMAHEFWQPFEFVAYRLARNGFSEEEVGDFIIAGFSAYRDMCSSFDDGRDCPKGTGFTERGRRSMARVLRRAWEDDVRFFDSHSIDMIFTTPSAAMRFRKRWRLAFEPSSINEEHMGRMDEDGNIE